MQLAVGLGEMGQFLRAVSLFLVPKTRFSIVSAFPLDFLSFLCLVLHRGVAVMTGSCNPLGILLCTVASSRGLGIVDDGLEPALDKN